MGVLHGNRPGNIAGNVNFFTCYLSSGDESDIFEDCQQKENITSSCHL